MKNLHPYLIRIVKGGYCLIVSFFIFSCSTSSTSNAVKTAQDNHVVLVDTLYRYEPNVYSFTGILKQELFYGPPGYGEDTLSDSKELVYILQLDKPISLLADTASDFNDAKANIKDLQVLSDLNLKDDIDKKASLTGTLFGAQTGHHYTEVLLDARK